MEKFVPVISETAVDYLVIAYVITIMDGGSISLHKGDTKHQVRKKRRIHDVNTLAYMAFVCISDAFCRQID